MRSFVDKKIQENLGESVPSLVEFVIGKLQLHYSPEELVSDLVAVLDEDAEIFVSKCWRMLIYEMIRASS